MNRTRSSGGPGRRRSSPARRGAAVALLALVIAVPLAGCVDRDVRQQAIVEYLNSDPTARAPGCPFPVHPDAGEGIVEAQGAHGFAVGPDARVYVAYPDRVEVVNATWEVAATWSLDGAADASKIAAGPGTVALGRRMGANWTLSTWSLDGDPVANRSLAGLLALAVAPDGSVLVGEGAIGDPNAPSPAASNLTVVRRDLTHVRTVVLPLDAPLGGVQPCGDRWFVVPWAVDASAVTAVRPDGTPAPMDPILIQARGHLAVGQGLVLASDASRGPVHELQVLTTDGDRLVDLRNQDGRPFGTFAVAHDLVYNLRGGSLLARPIADFLTKPG